MRNMLALAGVALVALLVPSVAFSSGVASHDLKRDTVTATLPIGTGPRTVSVTCPDGGVPLNWGAARTDPYETPIYYIVSEMVQPGPHGATGTFGADYDSGEPYDVRLTATCISLAD